MDCFGYITVKTVYEYDSKRKNNFLANEYVDLTKKQ
jgi:hypothetical protein